jgi:hypothetical protein
VVKKRNVGRLLKSGCNEEENEEILKLLFKNIPKKGVMLTPIFVNLFFGIPINSTTFSRFFYVCKLYSTPTLQYVYLLPLCSICRVSFILVEIIDCSLMMILSLGKAELGM